VDLGGTWVRIIARRGSGAARRTRLPAVDVLDLPPVLRRVGAAYWPATPVQALVVSSRGIWTRAECRRVERRLRRAARRVRVVPDAQAAYEGALGGGAGLLVLAGTGSIVIGRSAGGRWARAGGLGPLLGDEGSAFWIGREWLRATTQGEDFEPVRTLVHSRSPVARIAALAPGVLRRARRGDRLAGRVVRDAQHHLAGFVRAVATALRLEPPVRVSWAGSLLARDPWFRAGLRREVARAGLRARWIEPIEPPVAAAVRLAEALLAPRDPGKRGGRAR
jgi:N-acetylglucosamine kinase-like BadF-type ATPase